MTVILLCWLPQTREKHMVCNLQLRHRENFARCLFGWESPHTILPRPGFERPISNTAWTYIWVGRPILYLWGRSGSKVLLLYSHLQVIVVWMYHICTLFYWHVDSNLVFLLGIIHQLQIFFSENQYVILLYRWINLELLKITLIKWGFNWTIFNRLERIWTWSYARLSR